jgi:carbon monoxide dehydrogenase subunit G
MQRLPSLLALLLLLVASATCRADPEISVIVEKAGEAFVVEATARIQVPLRMAWEVLTDFDNMTAILSNLTSSKIVRRNDNLLLLRQEGRARYGIFTYTFASEREILLEPMRRIQSRQITGNAARFESIAILTPTEQGTAIRYHAEIVPDSGLAKMFGRPFIQDEVKEQWTALGAEMLRRMALPQTAGAASGN